jgi:hypothetical protein
MLFPLGVLIHLISWPQPWQIAIVASSYPIRDTSQITASITMIFDVQYAAKSQPVMLFPVLLVYGVSFLVRPGAMLFMPGAGGKEFFMFCPFSGSSCGLHACPFFIPASCYRPSACAIRHLADSSVCLAKDVHALLDLLMRSINP